MSDRPFIPSWERSHPAAIAEIERLQAEVVKWKREAGKYSAGCELCAAREAEIERLVAALENADQFIDLYVNGVSSMEDGKNTLSHVRAALERPTKEGE